MVEKQLTHKTVEMGSATYVLYAKQHLFYGKTSHHQNKLWLMMAPDIGVREKIDWKILIAVMRNKTTVVYHFLKWFARWRCRDYKHHQKKQYVVCCRSFRAKLTLPFKHSSYQIFNIGKT